jgi:hypothetical protein
LLKEKQWLIETSLIIITNRAWLLQLNERDYYN